eukprot:1911884-Rhodomonas_salina.1
MERRGQWISMCSGSPSWSKNPCFRPESERYSIGSSVTERQPILLFRNRALANFNVRNGALVKFAIEKASGIQFAMPKLTETAANDRTEKGQGGRAGWCFVLGQGRGVPGTS